MCADRTTNSFLRVGSEPGSLATMLEDSRDFVSMTAFALSEAANGKCGRGLRSLPKAAISAKVWPEPAKSCSAEAGLNVTPSCWPVVSLNSASARPSEGLLRLTEMRCEGVYLDAGFIMPVVP